MKRFFDTALWQKPWFMDLAPSDKVAWFYLIAECDNVGVWTPNFRLANFQIGTDIDWDDFLDRCNGNIIRTEKGKWWLVDFCHFQHPDLDEGSESNAVKSYVALLKKHGLYEQYVNGTCSVDQHSKVKERVKVKEQVREQDTKKDTTTPSMNDDDTDSGKKKRLRKTADTKHPTLDVPINLAHYTRLCEEYGKTVVDAKITTAINWVASKGKAPYADYSAAADNWLKRDGVKTRDGPHDSSKRCEKGHRYFGDVCDICIREEIEHERSGEESHRGGATRQPSVLPPGA